MPLDQAVKHFDTIKSEAFEWLHNELSTLRSGRVKPDMVESVMVEHYGARSPLKSLASVSSIDARSLMISPWDAGAITAIQKGLTEAQLGAMPTVDGQVIRLTFPSLTQEVRERTLKQLNKKAEEARVRLRVGRDEALKIIKKDKEDSTITEDDFYDGKKDLDERMEACNKEIADLLKKKETEITSV